MPTTLSSTTTLFVPSSHVVPWRTTVGTRTTVDRRPARRRPSTHCRHLPTVLFPTNRVWSVCVGGGVKSAVHHSCRKRSKSRRHNCTHKRDVTNETMPDLKRASTIHDDYLRRRGASVGAASRAANSIAPSFRTLCLVSGVSVALYYGYARRSATTTTSASASAAVTRGPNARTKKKHAEVWRSTWDKGTPRQHVPNLWHDPADVPRAQ